MTQTTRIGAQLNAATLRPQDLPGTHTTAGYRLILEGARSMIRALGWDRLAAVAAGITTRYNALQTAPVRLGTAPSEAPRINNVVNAKVGKGLSLVLPTYDGIPKPVITYQWVRGTNTNIAGATAIAYVPQVADVGSTLKCIVTATNGVGSPLVETTAVTNAVLA